MSRFNFTQLPPDGTGKRVSAINTLEFKFTYTGGTEFEVGDNVSNTTRKLSGTVIAVKNAPDFEVYIVLNRSLGSAMEAGDLLNVNGVDIATFDSLEEDMRSQSVVQVGGNNPLNTAHVNDFGAQVTSFATGDPQFDAFSKLQTSSTTTIREYQPVNDTLPELFSEVTENGATITWEPTRHVVQMTNPITNGARSLRRSNLYHKYQTGVATTAIFSAFSGGDYMGVTRRLGMFDDDDGLYFQMKDGVISVNIRSSCSGAPVENSVPQSEWNVDRLDGSGDANNLSGKQLSPGFAQVLFIDFQWLGAGRVRFGFNIDGVPIVCHEFNNAGKIANPYMRTGSLPFAMEQVNTATLSNPAFLYGISAAIKCEGDFTPIEKLYGGSLPVIPKIDDAVNYIPLASFRAKQTLPDGTDNRTVILPTNITVAETSSVNKPWLLELVKNDVLTGASYIDAFPETALEMDMSATASSNGTVIMAWTVTGDEHIDLSNFFNFYNELVIRDGIITDTPRHFSLRAKGFTGIADIDIVLAFNWKEIR